nr:GntR family transcriptional regulator [Mesorhizobium sp. YR577]
MSRGSLREALRRLEERKVVTRAPRLGAKIITDDEIAELHRIIEGQRARLESIGMAGFLNRKLDSDFHNFIAQCGRNEFLIKFLCEDYAALIGLYHRQLRKVPDRAQRAFVEHSRIVDALADPDPETAELAMRRHIQNSSQALLENVED